MSKKSVRPATRPQSEPLINAMYTAKDRPKAVSICISESAVSRVTPLRVFGVAKRSVHPKPLQDRVVRHRR